MKIEHPFSPVYDKNSKILILGSFPSVKSRENNFYYGHPQNRFWKVLASIFNQEVPITIDEKKKMLLKNNIAVWDILKSCEIEGSADSSIKEPIPNDINKIINSSNIEKVCFNGNTAYNVYLKKTKHDLEVETVILPSTSPANASYNLEKLIQIWKKEIN